MNDKSLILHIGHYKSGSSSIQNYMWDHRAEHTNQGVKYLVSGIAKERSVGIRHYYLGAELGKADCQWSKALEEIGDSNCSVFVVSHEGLARKVESEITYLASLLKGLEVKVVIYLRRQDLLAESLYAEWVQNQACTQNFEKFCDQHSWLFRYKNLIEPWIKEFGESSLTIKDFADVVNHRGSVIPDFLDLCGLGAELESTQLSYLDNPTMDFRDLQIMFSINHSRIGLNNKRGVASMLREARGKDREKPTFFDPESRHDFLSNYQEDIQWLRAMGLPSFDYKECDLEARGVFRSPLTGLRTHWALEAEISKLRSDLEQAKSNIARFRSENQRQSVAALELLQLQVSLQKKSAKIEHVLQQQVALNEAFENQLAAELNTQRSLLGSLRVALENLGQLSKAQQEQLTRKQEELDRLAQSFAAITHSLSWRLTRPFRQLVNLLLLAPMRAAKIWTKPGHFRVRGSGSEVMESQPSRPKFPLEASYAPTTAETEALMSKLPVVDIPELRKPNDFYSYKYISLNKVLQEIGLAGDWAQFGVYKGELARFLEDKMDGGRTLHLFDSFEGLPSDWVGIWKAGAFRLNEQELPVFDSENVVLHRGWFSESVPAFARTHNGSLAFLHIDCDLYSSTKDVLFGLNEKIERGTILLFDEFMMASDGELDNGEHRALVEWCGAFDRRIKYLWRTKWMQVAVRVL